MNNALLAGAAAPTHGIPICSPLVFQWQIKSSLDGAAHAAPWRAALQPGWSLGALLISGSFPGIFGRLYKT